MPVLELGIAEHNRLLAISASRPPAPSRAPKVLPPAPAPISRPRPRLPPAPAAAPAGSHPIGPPAFFPSSSSRPSDAAWLDILPYSLARGTLVGYSGTTRRFWTFCDEVGIAPPDRFPASDSALARFASSFAGDHAGSTAANAVATLKTWHGAHGHPWRGGTQLDLVLRAVANLAPPSSRRERRPAVTTDMLRSLHYGLNLSDPRDAAVYAAACLAFWGQCCLGELLGTSRLRHDPASHPSRSAISPSPSVGASCNLALLHTKTTGARGAPVHIPHQHGCPDPIFALANHFYVNAGLPASSHLFAFRVADTTCTCCLTREPFLDRCNAVWGLAGIPRITGHCFRIGGTNTFLEAGVAPDLVRVKGRWKSDAFFLYWRNHDRLTASATERISRPSGVLPRHRRP